MEDDGLQHGRERRMVGRVRGCLGKRVAERKDIPVAVDDRIRRVDEDAAAVGHERAWLVTDRDRLDQVRLLRARVAVDSEGLGDAEGDPRTVRSGRPSGLCAYAVTRRLKSSAVIWKRKLEP